MLKYIVGRRFLFKRNTNYRSMTTWRPRYFDIGVNFSDSMFQGCYNGSTTPKHPPDIDKVIKRAQYFNVKEMLVTASSIQESEEHFALCEKYEGELYSTVGVHPCSVSNEFYQKNEANESTDTLIPNIEEKLEKLKLLTVKGHEMGYVKAFGEIGLDYDRLHYSSKKQQVEMFTKQLEILASLKPLKLPLFLHMRNACDDFLSILQPFLERGDIEKGNGVIHSFTGTKEEYDELSQIGFYFGINGCSLKSEENLEVAAMIPDDKLMIETDAPWCEIRKSHASYKYITSYPNLFYPSKEEEVTNNDVQTSATKEGTSSKKNSYNVKYDEFLPIPSIKKENFGKHLEHIKKLEAESNDQKDSVIGELAYPLFKSRNEPLYVGYVSEILCAIKGYKNKEEIQQFIDLIYENTTKIFK
ncbi:Piso0_001495 [Millerozyma farinosa CBS 7064]|uniref:Piso0_001495 protein n=1 Tax=Pichia sorbitophila (strain ATCC MYA-4447 / BCRC 22081 / CBS 7064 / NBRC 10061 / NRRL Y-12695) TaxID=559304 RepID=G8YNB5_PICSO|nr:Piso0_001495 [Millerozyma farinosa CBS 7064]